MTDYQCDAQVGFKMISNAKSDDQIIQLAESLSIQRWGEGMDSLDLGDSMGVFIRASFEDFYRGDFLPLYMGDGFYVQMDIDFYLFQWGDRD